MTVIYQYGQYPLKMYPQTKHELPTSRLWKVIVLHTVYIDIYSQMPPNATETTTTPLREYPKIDKKNDKQDCIIEIQKCAKRSKNPRS